MLCVEYKGAEVSMAEKGARSINVNAKLTKARKHNIVSFLIHFFHVVAKLLLRQNDI